jgi:hypothetical protein
MKYVESQWKRLGEEGAQVCDGKKWLSPNDKTNRLADGNISMRR